MKTANKATIILVLSFLLLGVSGCAAKPQETAAPAETPSVTEPAAPSGNSSTGSQQEPDEQTQPPEEPVTPPKVSQPDGKPNSGQPSGSQPSSGQVAAPQQPSLVLGRGHDEESNKVTEPDNKFKAGERFYFGFDNGVPFGVSSILLQYESAQSGEVLNKYSIAVEPTQSYSWATISFKEPGQYKLVFMVNNTVRASQLFTIE